VGLGTVVDLYPDHVDVRGVESRLVVALVAGIGGVGGQQPGGPGGIGTGIC
jgi:hypothetical protein